MTNVTHLGGALATALLVSCAWPALAQEGGEVDELRPGSVLILVPETGATYQVPATVAAEVCPDLDESYLAPDFAGTAEVVCEVPQVVAEERDFAGAYGSGGDDAGGGQDDGEEAAGAGGDPEEVGDEADGGGAEGDSSGANEGGDGDG